MSNAFARACGHVKQSKIVSLALKLGLSLAAFWVAFYQVDLAVVKDIVSNQDHKGVVAALLLVIVQIILGGLRWRLVLRALSGTGRHVMSNLEALKLVYIGVFFNCCLPGTVGGDVVRVFLAKSDHIPLPVAINSVIIDRMIALIAVSFLVLFTLPLLGQAAGFNAMVVWAVVVVAAVLGLWLLKRIDTLLAPWKHIKPVHWLLHFVHCLKLLLKHPGVSAVSLVYALISHIGYCIAVQSLAESLGVHISVMQAVTFVPLVVLATTLPIAVGGWGVREAGMVGMLALAGVPKAAALALSIQLGLISIISSLPAGLIWLGYRKRQASR